MKTRVSAFAALILGVLALSIPVFAHHGAAAYDMTKPIILKNAVVTKYSWINPHPLIVVDYKDDKGTVQHWTTEMGSTPASQLIGWSRTTLKTGDVITMLMRDHNGADLLGVFTYGVHALERLTAGEAAIHQNAGSRTGEHGRVAAAATRQDGHAHRH